MRALCSKALIAVCFVVLLCCQQAAANDNAKRLTVMDVFNIEFAADPQISPDGKKVIYVRQFSDIMTDKRYSNLWIINFDGSEHRPLTTGHYNDSSPRWSPDGTKIVFTSDRDGSPQIYMRWMDTGQTAKLTNLQNPPRSQRCRSRRRARNGRNLRAS